MITSDADVGLELRISKWDANTITMETSRQDPQNKETDALSPGFLAPINSSLLAATMTPLAVLTKILYDLPASAFEDSYSFHDAIESALKKQGWGVIREFQVRKDDGGVGYIDLAVMHPVRIALELDFQSPRKKSVSKLTQFKGLRFVILRKGKRIIPVNEK